MNLADSDPVLFTAGRGEEQILRKVKEKSHPNIHAVPAGSLTLRELASLIFQSKVVVSNSTGPLHMAVALGVPTVSFYPQVPRVTSAKRWGPFGNQEINRVLSPSNPDSPMSSILVEAALEAVMEILRKSPTPS
jgi:ADP-heptose:LPS heptosyltransferase